MLITFLTRIVSGQFTFASPELLHQRGIDLKDATEPWSHAELLLSLDDISAAFWRSQHGTAMHDQLVNHPFDKCVVPAVLIPPYNGFTPSLAHSEYGRETLIIIEVYHNLRPALAYSDTL